MTNLNTVAKKLDIVAANTTPQVVQGSERKPPERMLVSCNPAYVLTVPSGFTYDIHFVSYYLVTSGTAGKRSTFLLVNWGGYGTSISPAIISADKAASSYNLILINRAGVQYVGPTNTSGAGFTMEIQPLPDYPMILWPGDNISMGFYGVQTGDTMYATIEYEKQSVVQ